MALLGIDISGTSIKTGLVDAGIITQKHLLILQFYVGQFY
jgi:hypothetical protein